jgi:uncharacterized membrane protein
MKFLFSSRCINIILSAIALVAILLFIITGKNHLLYDEFNFVPNILLLDKEGFTKTFLLKSHGSPGPLYPVYQHLFYNAHAFNIMSVRLANYFLMIILLFFIFLTSRLLGYKDPLILSLNFIIIPFTWVFCGLGLTEIPAMTCAMIGFYLFLKGFITDIKYVYKLLYVFIGGAFFSFAILGRSFYLMVIIAMLLWLTVYLFQERFISIIQKKRLWYFSTKKQALILITVLVISSLIAPLMVFYIWGGLTPPLGTEAVGANKLKIVPWYGILAFAYSGFIALLLAPSWFVAKKKFLLFFLGCTILLIIANIFLKIVEFAPLRTAISRIIPSQLFLYYGYILPGILASLAAYFIFSTVIRLYTRRLDKIYLLTGLIAMLIVFSTIKVTTQFSSRYVGQVLPFFILLFAPYEKTNWTKIFRMIIGLVIGFLSLSSYYSGNY